MGEHLIDGEFQSDKYPTCPRGKVPLSCKDPSAQDLLWEYARRRRAVDCEFSDDLKDALRLAGYEPKQDDDVTEDLMLKVADDVTKAVIRTLSIAPHPLLPVAVSGAAAALGVVAAELDKLAGVFEAARGPGNDNILLAGLLAARMGISCDDGVSAAYRDYAALDAAGLAPAPQPERMDLSERSNTESCPNTVAGAPGEAGRG